VSRVVLIGGEPTLNTQFVDMIRFFRSKGIVVTLTSNVLRLF
jgi:MoaA/NifB/PqqE/SkfB family radical SAM enzyme